MTTSATEPTVTAGEIAALRREHYSWSPSFTDERICSECDVMYPCPTIRALDALEAAWLQQSALVAALRELRHAELYFDAENVVSVRRFARACRAADDCLAAVDARATDSGGETL